MITCSSQNLRHSKPESIWCTFCEHWKFDKSRNCNGFALLLESVLGDKTLTGSESQHCESINTYIEQILIIPVRPCHVDYRNNLICHQQDILKVNGGIQKL
ncbi:uncharacterized protein LOC122025538 [Zingiber officinale]|uniref:uncharacterized protein LOC122025538 n=1 Tax=Zingiber officinale TaxID=94328 RepID=UPI001C4BE232|nr:uncharacterized protein LOC122025538 [Zingiber officinale]XP_042440286.1 uncharacterized protein LOC122025538 [Zingiber officinale]